MELKKNSAVSFDDGPGPSVGFTREHFSHPSQRDEFKNLTFHGGAGATLEMRLFTKRSLESTLRACGFEKVEFEFRDYPESGIVFGYPWSRPLTARKIAAQPW